MSCCPATLYPTDQQRYGVVPDTPCGSISIDLLNMYKRPIDCYIKYGLAYQIQSTPEELESASLFLQGFMDQKAVNQEDCTGIEMLPIIRSLVNRIVKKGVCL